jgi:transmembrane sensor
METKPKLDEVERAAAAWLAKRDLTDWSKEDQDALDQWLAASASHRVSYIRQLSIWREGDRLKSLSPGFPKGAIPPRGMIEQAPYFSIRRKHLEDEESDREESAKSAALPTVSRVQAKRYAVAAAAVLTLGSGFVAYTTGFADHGQTFTTPVGGLSTIPTADGSTITLNTDTEISVHLGEKDRRIELERGEAFFDVAKDPTRPFVVHAHNQRVVAVGTRFSVRLNTDAVHVAVTEGKIRVEQQSRLPILARLTEPSSAVAQNVQVGGKADIRIAVAGNVVDIRNRRSVVRQRPLAEIEQSLSWRTGYVVLDRAPLPEAIAEFNRYNSRQLVIEDPALEEIRVGGNFRSTNVEGFARLIEQAFAIEAQEQGNMIVLKRRR